MGSHWPVAVILGILLAGCQPDSPSTRPPPELDEVAESFREVPYRSGPLPKRAKVFLVAGGDDIANFTAEVLEQKRLWHGAGLDEQEVICYWAKPTPKAYRRDRAQYDRLASAVRHCYPANPGTVLSHLHTAAERNPPFVYLYVTGHGLQSVLQWARSARHRQDALSRLSASEQAILDQTSVGLEAAGGPGLEDVDAILRGHRRDQALHELMFTPRSLAGALRRFPDDAAKIVIVQACYSGGFITRDGRLTSIEDVPDLTVITATRHDRPSFGCGAGDETTHFGGAFTRALAEHLQAGMPPPQVPWGQIYRQTTAAVEALEAIEGERPSEPRWFRSTTLSE